MGSKARYIPEEIVLNILPKLPAHSLFRFRCVCKKWCSWITNGRKFIIKSGSDPYNDDYKESSYAASPCSIQSIDETTGEIQDINDDDIPWETNHIVIYGSCNGLLLIAIRDDLFLWNPSLGSKKKLFSYYPLSYNGPKGYRIVGGLCFDSVNNEYKIVLALAHYDPDFGGEFVAVGSPRNRTWTHIISPCDVDFLNSGPVLNNRLHWYVSSYFDADPNALFYFDTKIDDFVELPMPPRRRMRKGKEDFVVTGGLGVLNGCLCMTRSIGGYEQRYTTVEVLGMMEYGVKESWSILFIIKGVDLWRGVVPLFFVGNRRSKVLLKAMKRPSDHIIIYDRVSESHTDVTSTKHMRSGVVYEETLVKPIGYGWEELDARGEAFYVEKTSDKYTRTMKRDHGCVWSIVKEDWNESKEDRKLLESKEDRKLHTSTRRRRRSDASFWSKGKCPW